MGWQWHQLDHMQIICTSLQTDNHATTLPFSFYSWMPFLPPTNSTEGKVIVCHYALLLLLLPFNGHVSRWTWVNWDPLIPPPSSALEENLCFDTVAWASGRASRLSKIEWWGAGMVICLKRGTMICRWYVCHPISSRFMKIQIGLTFLASAYQCHPDKEAVKWVSVCTL